MAKIPVKLIGRNSYLCDACFDKLPHSDPIKSSPTPHCTDCGKHHPIHIGCNGKSLAPAQIDYIALFYQNPSVKDSIGIA